MENKHGVTLSPPLSRPESWDSTTIHLLEVDFVHLELGLKDSRGQDAAAKQVLEQRGGSVSLPLIALKSPSLEARGAYIPGHLARSRPA